MLLLLERAHWIADADHLQEEWKHIQRVFLNNGYYAWQEIKWVFTSYDHKRKVRPETEVDLIWWVAMVPYCNTVTNQLAWLLGLKNLIMTSYPSVKTK